MNRQGPPPMRRPEKAASSGGKENEPRTKPRAALTRLFANFRHVLSPAVLMRVVRRLLANHGVAFAGQLAYFFVLFLFPFLTFAVSLAGIVVGNPEPVLVGLAARADGLLPQEAIEPIKDHRDRTLGSPSSPAFVSSVLFTLGVGSAAADAIAKAANRSYGMRETRPFWKVRGVAILLIFGFTLLIAILLFAVYARRIQHRLPGRDSPTTAGSVALLVLPGEARARHMRVRWRAGSPLSDQRM